MIRRDDRDENRQTRSQFTGLPIVAHGEAMTLRGTINRTFALLALVALTASWTWNKFWIEGDPSRVGTWMGRRSPVV